MLQFNKKSAATRASVDSTRASAQFYGKKFAQSALYSYLCITKLVTHSDEPGF